MGQAQHELRRAERRPVVLPARCRSRTGFLDRVIIADINQYGCRVESSGLVFRAGALVVIRPDGLEWLCGQVRWVDGHTAGIAFDRPLYVPVVEHIWARHAQFLQCDAPAPAPHLRAA